MMSLRFQSKAPNAAPLITAPDAAQQAVKRRLIFLLTSLVAIVAYFAPFLVLGAKSYITIHDNLDGEFVDYYLLVKTGKALAFAGATQIPNIMNGLPRAALPSALNLSILMFYVFPPCWAYIVNFILVHIIALIGMFLLLRKHILKEEKEYLLAGAVSLCFFLIPYYTTYGISVAGQPLLAYAFLNIRNGERDWKNYLIILMFPFWSDIALIGPFAVTGLGLILLIDWIRSRVLNKQYLFALAILVGTYGVLQFQLIDSILGSHSWVSHRTTWNRWTDFNILSNLKRVFELLFTTQYHTGSFPTFPTILAVIVAFMLLLAGKRRPNLLDAIGLAIALICLEYGFYDWFVRLFGRFLPGLQTFNASRFYFLLPLLWMIAFALSLKEMNRTKVGLAAAWCLIAVQAFTIVKTNTEYKNNVRILRGRRVDEPSFDRFFAQDLFAEIDHYIGRPKQSYRVVSIGMHPSVAQFNGFYTLDAYLTNYSLAYKYEFRKIIRRELDKDAQVRNYFDGWGNRCYVYPAELKINSLCSAGQHLVLHHLDLDTAQLRALGGEYVISAVFIEDGERVGLELEKDFFSTNSFWHIYLYRVAVPAIATTQH